MTRAVGVIGGALALSAALYLFPDRTIAPGKVRDAHAAFQKDCVACHDLFHGASSEKCQTCHVVDARGAMMTIGAQNDARRSTPFHQALIKTDCVACHSEHAGTSAYRTKISFSHELLQPEVKTQCQSCHSKPDDKLHRKVAGECGGCHRPTKWRDTTVDHSKFFVLDEDHNAPCATCHIAEDLKSYSCFGCHQHRRDKTAAFHKKRGIRDIGNCVTCHKGAHDKHDD